MTLAIDERTVRRRTCEHCGSNYEHVTGFVSADGDAHAAYFAACHGHPEHEAQIDVIVGPWGEGSEPEGRAHFSCFLRPDGAMAVDAPVAITVDAPLVGLRLTREAALSHELLPRFWEVVDLLTEADPSVRDSVYQDPPLSLWRRLLHRFGLLPDSSDIARR